MKYMIEMRMLLIFRLLKTCAKWLQVKLAGLTNRMKQFWLIIIKQYKFFQWKICNDLIKIRSERELLTNHKR